MRAHGQCTYFVIYVEVLEETLLLAGWYLDHVCRYKRGQEREA